MVRCKGDYQCATGLTIEREELSNLCDYSGIGLRVATNEVELVNLFVVCWNNSTFGLVCQLSLKCKCFRTVGAGYFYRLVAVFLWSLCSDLCNGLSCFFLCFRVCWMCLLFDGVSHAANCRNVFFATAYNLFIITDELFTDWLKSFLLLTLFIESAVIYVICSSVVCNNSYAMDLCSWRTKLGQYYSVFNYLIYIPLSCCYQFMHLVYKYGICGAKFILLMSYILYNEEWFIWSTALKLIAAVMFCSLWVCHW